MSRAYKCDICCKLYEKTSDLIPELRIERWIYNPMCTPADKQIYLDLCPKCQEKLYEFVGLKKKEEGKKHGTSISM